jgi:hypothetical protein
MDEPHRAKARSDNVDPICVSLMTESLNRDPISVRPISDMHELERENDLKEMLDPNEAKSKKLIDPPLRAKDRKDTTDPMWT